MQTSYCEQMQRARLLKWFFDVFRRLMTQTENNATQKILHLWRIVESATNRGLHPGARLLGGPQDRISPATSQQDTVLRIANKKTSSHILPREIRTHIEFARIAWRRNRFGDAEQFQFIAEFGTAAPANKQRRVGRYG